MRDEDRLNTGLLRERQLRRQRAGIDPEPIVEEVAGKIVFRV